MAHRIIILSDGTGNAASKVWRTNVWRVFELLDLSGPDQVAKYDDGVGSSAFKPLALLGGAFGWGLKRNVIDLYKFVCRNYRPPSPGQPGSQIYAFGFSRGAFTIRVLIGLILEQGLAPYQSEQDLHARARAAYRAFRAEHFHSVFRVEQLFRKLRDAWIVAQERLGSRKPYDRSENIVVPSIEFIGIWDTVAAYGLPIEEMTRGVSQWIWPLELPNRTLDTRVLRACHALALDDERTTFHPVLWTEEGEEEPARGPQGNLRVKDERISQIWFVGAHSNVGGGYPDDALAHVPLHWIMEQAQIRGLSFKAAPKADPDAFRRVSSARDKDGRQYDSRSGLGGYYRYGPRKIADFCHMRLSGRKGDSVRIDVPKIHESALARIRSDANAYAPIGLPATYAVVTDDGRILKGTDNLYETPAEASARAREQEKIWNLVWLRRIVYFATLFASFHLVAFWLFHDFKPEREHSSPVKLVSETVRLAESFLPRQVARWWTDYYATNPVSFLIGIAAVAILIWLGSRLGAQITDSMRVIWKSRAQQSTIENSAVHTGIYRLRETAPYKNTIQIGRRHVIPFISAVFILWLGTVFASHLLFNVVDAAGLFCRATLIKETQTLNRPREKAGDKPSQEIIFSTNQLCFPTKVILKKGASYSIKLTVDEPWADDGIATTPRGYRTSELLEPGRQPASLPQRVRQGWHWARTLPTIPLRRIIFQRWFTVIARIGSSGQAEDFLQPSPVAGPPNTYEGVTQKLKRDGELFLYVNEAVIALPLIHDLFYRNNHGKARVVITRL